MRFGTLLLATVLTATSLGQMWTELEKDQILDYWSQPNRLVTGSTGKPGVRLTVEGSKWLWEYNRRRGKGKTPPGQVPPFSSEQEKAWEAWIDAKVAYDRWKVNPNRSGETPDPGPAPADLVSLADKPPVFAEWVTPGKYQVSIDGSSYSYEDNLDMRPRFAYYRFKNGVRSFGTKLGALPATELNSILGDAGVNESEARVFRSVSLLEGGFDSINTYDTGFISVGFIQFAALAEGGHSLGQSLLQYKMDDPIGFQKDFHRLGVEVDAKGVLVALNLGNRKEDSGAKANDTIIGDKRLTAVFQRAGLGKGYRVAQVKTAKRMYWPANEKWTIKKPDGTTVSGTVAEVILSEAGMSVFLDRKVNTGNIGGLSSVLQMIADEEQDYCLDALKKYEKLVLACLWYRHNSLIDPSLSQPAECEMIPSILEKFKR